MRQKRILKQRSEKFELLKQLCLDLIQTTNTARKATVADRVAKQIFEIKAAFGLHPSSNSVQVKTNPKLSLQAKAASQYSFLDSLDSLKYPVDATSVSNLITKLHDQAMSLEQRETKVLVYYTDGLDQHSVLKKIKEDLLNFGMSLNN